MTSVPYKEIARYYDRLYHAKNYSREVELLHKLIYSRKKIIGNELLDVGCGTGNHFPYLQKYYTVTGTDSSRDMLRIAKSKFPEIKFFQADMISIKYNKRFDVIVCLFSSIGYVKTYSNLKKTISNFYKLLNPGGIVVIQPWFVKNIYPNNTIIVDTYTSPQLTIKRSINFKIKRL